MGPFSALREVCMCPKSQNKEPDGEIIISAFGQLDWSPLKSSSSGEILGIAQPEFLVLHYTISSVYDTSNSSNNKGDYSAGLVK